MNRVLLMGTLLTVVLVLSIQLTSAQFNNCQNFRPNCDIINPRRCRNNGGEYLPHGDVCGYCDICAIFVGRGARCNLNIPPPRPTPTCRRPLRCVQGRCQ